MRKSSLIKIIAMILALCMFLTSCNAISGALEGVLEKVFGKDQEQFVENEGSDDCHHANTTLKNAKAATCDAEGYTGDKVCTSCNAVVEKGTSIPSPAHNTALKNEKPATCTAEGYTGDKVCTDCGTIVEKGSSVPVIAHSFDDGMITKLPTCIDAGTLTYTCTQCGATRSESLPTVAHDDRYHDMLDGTHNHTCTTCTLTENEAHVPTDAGVYTEATCTEMGYTTYTCSICNLSYKVYDENAAATGHSYSEWTELRNATCISAGSKSHRCNTCGYEERITLDATPDAHDIAFSHYAPAPTCGDAGVAVYECKDCGAFGYNKDVAATGAHTYGGEEQGDDGWVRKTCTECDYVVSTFDASKLKDEGVSAQDIPTDVPLSVTNETAAMEFPPAVLEQFKSGENVKIDAGIVDAEKKNELMESAKEKLSEEEKARLENVDLYDFTVKIDDVDLSGNFSAAVTVTIPYQLKTFVDEDGNEYTEDAEGIIIWYVSANGDIEKITDVTYNAELGTVTFLAPHFSMYAVAYEETPQMKCRRGYHTYDADHTYVFPASCSSYGYTVHECTVCGRTYADNIVERGDHVFGEVLDPQPTCTSGDYQHRICENCGYRHDIFGTYVRSLGHQVEAPASCNESSVCTRCQTIVSYPLGHNWTEWRVVVPATEHANGLKVRYCLRCGISDSVEISSTGTITGLDFESYEEMAEAIYDLLIGLDNGVIEMSYGVEGQGKIDLEFTINRNSEGLLVRVDYVFTDYEGEVHSGSAFYRNGVLIADIYGEEDASIGITTIESQIFMPINIMLTYMEGFYDIINPYAEYMFGTAREELVKYIELLGDEVNAVLSAAGSEYTAEQLIDLFDIIESVYTCVSIKLGYNTDANMNEDFELPTKQQLVLFVAAFMEKTEEDGYTTYSFNADEFVASVRNVIDWVYDRCERNVASVLFELLGDEIAKIDPSITNTDALVEYLKTNLPGTLLVSEALEKLDVALEASGVMTLADIYEAANALLYEVYGEEVDVEVMLEEYYDVTLNDLIAAMFANMGGGESDTIEPPYDKPVEWPSDTPDGGKEPEKEPTDEPKDEPKDEPIEEPKGEKEPEGEKEPNPEKPDEYPGEKPEEYPEEKPEEKPEEFPGGEYPREPVEPPTAEELYDMIGEYLENTMFGDLPMPTVISVATSVRNYFSNIKEYLDYLEITAGIEFTLDSQGKLVSLYLDEVVNYVTGDGSEGGTLQNLNIKIDRDATAQVVIPEKYAPADFNVETGYDQNGNFVISGIPADYDVSASLKGAVDIDLKSVLQLDRDMSTKLGFDVYSAPKHLWTEADDGKLDINFAASDTYILMDGKYYTYGVYTDFFYQPTNSDTCRVLDIFEFVSDPSSLLPEEGTEPDFYFEGTAVYMTGLGLLANINGEWWICEASFKHDKTNANISDAEIAYLWQQYSFTETFLNRDVMLSMIESVDMWYGPVYNNTRVVIQSGDEIIELYGFSSSEGVLAVYYMENGNLEHYNSSERYVLYYEVDFSKVKYDFMHTDTRTVEINVDGNPETREVTLVSIGRYVPTYYYKLPNGKYVSVGMLRSDVDTNRLNRMEIGNGRKMYVLGVKDSWYVGLDEGSIYYGYVQISPDYFIRAYCVVVDGLVTKVVYEGETDRMTVNYNQAFDLNANIIRRADGALVISADFVEQLKDSCTRDAWYVGIEITATKTTADENYMLMFSKALKYNMGEIIGTATTSEQDYFHILFEKNDDEVGGIRTYIDENGDLVLEANAIYKIETNFKETFPADSFLEYDTEASSGNEYDIYSFEIIDKVNPSFVFYGGEYYHYNEIPNYLIETGDIYDFIQNRWYICEATPVASIEAGEETPDEIVGLPVYELLIGFAINDHYLGDPHDARITLYGFITDGELMILTGAHRLSDSIVKFEGYTPISDYMNALSVNTGYTHENYFYVNGVLTTLEYTSIELVEPEVNGTTGDTKVIHLYKTLDEKYVLGSTPSGAYLKLGEVAEIESGFVRGKTLEQRYVNGEFTVVTFHGEISTKYYAIEIGGRFYDFEWFKTNSPWISQSRFEEIMYNTDRIYAVWDDEIGGFAYYDSFTISGDYIILQDRLDEVDIPDGYNETVIGEDMNGYKVYEIWYYTDSGSQVYSMELEGGDVFYYRDGAGYIKFGNGQYVKATLVTDNDGNTYPVALIKRAYVKEYMLDNYGLIYKYLSFDGMGRLVIPRELCEIMESMYGNPEIIITFSNGMQQYLTHDDLHYWFYGEMVSPDEGEIYPDEKPKEEYDKER